MNQQRIRDQRFKAVCKVCDFSEIGRELGRDIFWEDELATLPDHCPHLRGDLHGTCPHFPNRAEIIPL
jgi:hypothetical protein